MPKKKNKSKPSTRKSAATRGTVPAKQNAAKQPSKNTFEALLKRPQGASIEELSKATGWLPHSCRAKISGLRKAGFKIEKSKSAARKLTYRIVDSQKPKR